MRLLDGLYSVMIRLPSQDSNFLLDLRRNLAAWYRISARDLPWRKTNDPYRIWISEVMLQQTRVETVVDYYHRFVRIFPTVQTLAASNEDTLLKAWEGLGYYRRARNLRKAAQEIVQQRGGCFPENADEWVSLPGIGRYTSAAIASIAAGEAVAVLDGNVKRVLSRLFAIHASIDKREVERQLWSLAERLLDRDNPGDHNQAMMELGATTCLPRSPRCGSCPLATSCKAKRKNLQDRIPVRNPKEKIPTRSSVALLLRRSDGALLIARRPGDGLLGGLWEFPQVQMKDRESISSAFLRLTSEFPRIAVEKEQLPIKAKHTYSHFRLNVSAIQGTTKEKAEEYLKQSSRHSSTHNSEKNAPVLNYLRYTWLTPENRQRYALHRAHQKILEALSK